MEFDKSKVYSAVNADELKVGSKVIVADSLRQLKIFVENNCKPSKLVSIRDESMVHRFRTPVQILEYDDNDDNDDYSGNFKDCVLAYLVEEPEKLKWTDLKLGDCITSGVMTAMVTQIDYSEGEDCHIYAGQTWITDNELKEWRKVND